MALKVISAGEFTRSEVGPGGVIVRSCIDHWDTNIPEKLSFPELIAVGSSDQLGIVVKKFTKAAKLKPKIINKRSYKLFNIEYFLTDILTNNLNEKITACEDLEEAAEIFESSFGDILDKHAPIKKIQVRKNYLPYLSDETKLIIEDRKALKEEAVKTAEKVLELEAKRIGKEIKKASLEDEKRYYEKDVGDNVDVTTAWRAANEIMGSNENLAPTAIVSTQIQPTA